MTHEPDGPWYYQQIDLGYNYRLTDIQAALGLSQLRRLDECVRRRNELARRYDKLLGELSVTLPWQRPDSYSSRHLYVIRLQLNCINATRREVFDFLHARQIGVNLHYIPIHMQPYYQALGFRKGDYPVSERYYEEAITLPLYSSMTDSQQDKVVSVLSEVVSQ